MQREKQVVRAVRVFTAKYAGVSGAFTGDTGGRMPSDARGDLDNAVKTVREAFQPLRLPRDANRAAACREIVANMKHRGGDTHERL